MGLKAPSTATFAGGAVTITVCAVTLGFAGSSAWLFLHGHVTEAKELVPHTLGALSTCVALLSRTRPDPTAGPTTNVVTEAASFDATSVDTGEAGT